MGRRAKEYKTKLIRACVRATYIAVVKRKLSEKNYFNPEKPAHGDFSELLETLLLAWLRQRLKPETYKELLVLKDIKQVPMLDLSPPKDFRP